MFRSSKSNLGDHSRPPAREAYGVSRRGRRTRGVAIDCRLRSAASRCCFWTSSGQREAAVVVVVVVVVVVGRRGRGKGGGGWGCTVRGTGGVGKGWGGGGLNSLLPGRVGETVSSPPLPHPPWVGRRLRCFSQFMFCLFSFRYQGHLSNTSNRHIEEGPMVTWKVLFGHGMLLYLVV